MKKIDALTEWIEIGVVIAALTALTGCVGWVDGGGGGAVVVAPAPDVYLFGGGYDRGRDVRAYRDRGAASREAAHGGGGHERGRR